MQTAWADDGRLQEGHSCLHGACLEGHVEVAKYLVEVGGKELLMLRDNVSAWAGSVAYVRPFVSHVHVTMHVHAGSVHVV